MSPLQIAIFKAKRKKRRIRRKVGIIVTAIGIVSTIYFGIEVNFGEMSYTISASLGFASIVAAAIGIKLYLKG